MPFLHWVLLVRATVLNDVIILGEFRAMALTESLNTKLQSSLSIRIQLPMLHQLQYIDYMTLMCL